MLCFMSLYCSTSIQSFLAFRLMISSAATRLMVKRMDLQQQHRSIIEYGNNVIPHFPKSSPLSI